MPTPADELRQAATLIRQRAEETAKPHHPYSDERIPLVDTTEGWSREVANYLGGDMGEHCAAWHPAVALAVADLLDSLVDYYEGQQVEPQPKVLAIARAYLGTDQTEASA